MNNNIEIFKENFEIFTKTINWLDISYKKCNKTGIKNKYTKNELESFEALCARFGRTIDVFINKFLRGLDILELENIETRLDIVFRAEKRGFVDSADDLIAMKDLRNEIVHEYLEDSIISKFNEVLKYSLQMLMIYDKAKKYCLNKRYI
ncbi:MAG: hypothetical protein ACYCT7_07900 [bacterium]